MLRTASPSLPTSAWCSSSDSFYLGTALAEPAGMNLPLPGVHEGHDVCNAREHGLVGNGGTNDQPALAALVERLRRGFARDHPPPVDYVPPGDTPTSHRGTGWERGGFLTRPNARP